MAFQTYFRISVCFSMLSSELLGVEIMINFNKTGHYRVLSAEYFLEVDSALLCKGGEAYYNA